MMMLKYHFYDLLERYKLWRDARKAEVRMNAMLRRNRFVETAPGRWEQR